MIQSLVLLAVLLAPWAAEGRKASQSLTEKMARSVERRLDEALVPPPQDGEVCFTPGEPCDIKLWKFIQSAKTSLDIAIYDVTHPKIVHEILVASKRIPVRVLVDGRQTKGEHSLVSLLVKGGATVKVGRQRGIMHHKFTVLDGSRLQTGSFNYTVGASEKNQENQLYLADPKIVARYQERFDQMWTEAKPLTSPVAKKP